MKRSQIFFRTTLLFVVLVGVAVIAPLTSFAGELELVVGNPKCEDYSLTYGFKIDYNPNDDIQGQSYTYDIDGVNTITIYKQTGNESGFTIDWSSTMGIDLVIMKGSDAANLYYYDESTGDTGLVTPTNSSGGNAGISHVDFCFDYELTASKTVNTYWDRTYTWDITKSVSPASADRFIGESATFDYTVTADRTTTDDNHKLSGSVTVSNPTPFTVTASISDQMGGEAGIDVALFTDQACTIAASDPIILGPGGAVTQYYCVSANGFDYNGGTNVVTASVQSTSDSGIVGDASGSAGIEWSADPSAVFGNSTVNVNDSYRGADPVSLGSATGDDPVSFTYSHEYTCSEGRDNYTNGSYSIDLANTATIVETSQSDDASVTVNCYMPLTGKDASTVYTREYTWEITKVTDGDYVGFPGDNWDHPYQVSVTRTTTESGFTVSGTITVENPNPSSDLTVSVSDAIGDAAATLSCGGSLTVPAATDAGNGVATCDYSVSLGSKTDGTNNASVMFGTLDFPASAGFAFRAEPDASLGDTIIGHANVNVTDDKHADPDWATSLAIPTSDSVDSVGFPIYTRNFACPTAEGAYTAGVYTAATDTNTAEIVETGQKDTADVNVTCYAPVVSKTVIPAWEQDFQWNIFKNVDNTTFDGNPNDGWTFNYDIDVELASYDELNFTTSGVIEVTNPDPTNTMVVGLNDTLGSFSGVITADADCDFDGANLTLIGGATATCGYTMDMGDDQDANKDVVYTNTATATIGGGSFVGTADFTFNDVDPTLADGSEPASVTVTDDMASAANADDDLTSTTITATTQDVLSYSQSGTCPTEITEYTNGEYSVELTNIAKINETTDSDTETVTVNCYAPVVSKTAQLHYNTRYDWSILKTVDMSGPLNTEGVSVFVDDVLTFDSGDLTVWDIKYDIAVQLADVDGTDNDWFVDGTVTVTNSNPEDAMDVTLDDQVAMADGTTTAATFNSCVLTGTETSVAIGDGNAVTIPNSGSVTCSYSTATYSAHADANPFGSTNTATASINGLTASSGPVDIEDNGADMIEDECVTVTDNNGTPDDASDDTVVGTVCAAGLGDGGLEVDANGSYTFTHTIGLTAGDFECGESTFTNIAYTDENDTDDTDNDDAVINVNVTCGLGCTRTPGYWKTHAPDVDQDGEVYSAPQYDSPGNHYAVANLASTSDWLAWYSLPQGPSTKFLFTNWSSGKGKNAVRYNNLTYYDVLWIAPQGDADMILANAYVAAYLNTRNGASDSLIAGDLEKARQHLAGELAREDSLSRGEIIQLAGYLDAYNNGLLDGGPPHCD